MKAQMSVEYITTYSWALVIVAVIVGTLIYYGAFEEEAQITESCDLGPQIDCNEFYITPSGELSIKLRNNINDEVDIISLKVNEEIADCAFSSTIIYPGEEAVIFCRLTHTYFGGDKEIVDVEITFSTASSTSEFTSNGKLILKVTEEEVGIPEVICDTDGDNVDNAFCGGNDCDDDNPNIGGPYCSRNTQCEVIRGFGSTCKNAGTCNAFCTEPREIVGCPPNCLPI